MRRGVAADLLSSFGKLCGRLVPAAEDAPKLTCDPVLSLPVAATATAMTHRVESAAGALVMPGPGSFAARERNAVKMRTGFGRRSS